MAVKYLYTLHLVMCEVNFKGTIFQMYAADLILIIYHKHSPVSIKAIKYRLDNVLHVS